tara:strand:+ start:602 stop:781 length:180 start_codon:yes stop_codon:yes gene_type:complete
MSFIILPLLYAFFFAFLTAYIASKKNYKVRSWFWLGFLLGFIAMGILLLQPSKLKPEST